MSGPYVRQVAPRLPVPGLRCLRCHSAQPPLPRGVFTCVVCGAVLPLQRWVAHSPPGGLRPRPRPRSPESGNGAYTGPPAYRTGPPRWGFPAAVWAASPATAAPPDPIRPLRTAAVAAWCLAAVALLAAAAETWRFALMLEGRIRVLSGAAVSASDVLVAAAGLALVVAFLTAAVLSVRAVLRAYRFGADRAGRTPPRSTRGVLLRLLVPVWNVYGAGQVAAEIDTMLSHDSAGGERHVARPHPLVLGWWVSWVLNAAVLLATVLRGWGESLQAIADTVELHIVLDLTAAITAALAAAMLTRFARLAVDRPPTLGSWTVRPPPPTRLRAPASTVS